MGSDEIERLEKLVDRLLRERTELLQRNDALTSEQARISGELDSLLAKLDRLERKGQ